MDRLRAAAPDVFNSMGLPSLPPNLANLATGTVLVLCVLQGYVYTLYMLLI